jgi:phospholipase/carboxylesterase
MLDGPRLAPLSGSRLTSLVILIHGYGSNGEDLISLARMIQPALPDTALVAPDAPSLIPQMADVHHWWPIVTFSIVNRR